MAHYDDSYVCDNGTWRFAARTLVPHYVGAPDLSGTFSSPTSAPTTPTTLPEVP